MTLPDCVASPAGTQGRDTKCVYVLKVLKIKAELCRRTCHIKVRDKSYLQIYKGKGNNCWVGKVKLDAQVKRVGCKWGFEVDSRQRER